MNLKEIEQKLSEYEVVKFSRAEVFSIKLKNGVTVNANYTNGVFKNIIVDGGDQEKVNEIKSKFEIK